MALYATQKHGEDGVAVTFQAIIEAGDTFKCDGKTVVRWKKTGVAARTATIVGSKLSDQGFKTDLIIALTATLDGYMESPLLRPSRFGSTATVTYSAGSVADVTAAAVEMNDDNALT